MRDRRNAAAETKATQVNAEETRSLAALQSTSADSDFDIARAIGGSRALSRVTAVVSSRMVSAVWRTIYHMADLLERLDDIRTAVTTIAAPDLSAVLSALDGIDSRIITSNAYLGAVNVGQGDVRTAVDLARADANTSAAQRYAALIAIDAALDTLHADLVALLPAAVTAPIAGTLTGAVIGTPMQISLAGRVERVVFWNSGGAAVELELRVGGVRVDRFRVTPNSRETVGTMTAALPVFVVPISGSAANLTATLWSVVYR